MARVKLNLEDYKKLKEIMYTYYNRRTIKAGTEAYKIAQDLRDRGLVYYSGIAKNDGLITSIEVTVEHKYRNAVKNYWN